MLKRTVVMVIAAFIVLTGTANLFAQAKADSDRPKAKTHGQAKKGAALQGRRGAPNRVDMEKMRAELRKKMEERKTWIVDFSKAYGEKDKAAMGALIEKMDKIVEADKIAMEERRAKMEERIKADPNRMKAMEERKAKMEERRTKADKGVGDPNAPKRGSRPMDANRMRGRGAERFEKWFSDVKEAYKADDNEKLGALVEQEQKRMEQALKRRQEAEKRMKDRGKPAGKDKANKGKKAGKGPKANKGNGK